MPPIGMTEPPTALSLDPGEFRKLLKSQELGLGSQPVLREPASVLSIDPELFKKLAAGVEPVVTKPPLSARDVWARMSLSEKVPFIGSALHAWRLWDIKSAMDRMTEKQDAPEYQANPQSTLDAQLVGKYLAEREEVLDRGMTYGAEVLSTLSDIPAFVVEFWATGGLAALAKKGVKGVGLRLIKGSIERGITRTVARAGVGVAAAAAGAAARTVHPLMLGRTAAAAARFEMPEARLTPEGTLEILRAGDRPVTAWLKAFGNTWVENFSEVVGPTLRRIALKAPLAGPVLKRIGSAIKSAYTSAGLGTSVQFIKRVTMPGGFDGILEEMGEERVAGVLHAVLGTEISGAENPDDVFSRLYGAIPSGRQLAVEFGAFVAMGGLFGAAGLSVSKLAQRRLNKVLGQLADLTPEESGPYAEHLAQIGSTPEAKDFHAKMAAVSARAPVNMSRSDYNHLVGQEINKIAALVEMRQGLAPGEFFTTRLAAEVYESVAEAEEAREKTLAQAGEERFFHGTSTAAWAKPTEGSLKPGGFARDAEGKQLLFLTGDYKTALHWANERVAADKKQGIESKPVVYEVSGKDVPEAQRRGDYDYTEELGREPTWKESLEGMGSFEFHGDVEALQAKAREAEPGALAQEPSAQREHYPIPVVPSTLGSWTKKPRSSHFLLLRDGTMLEDKTAKLPHETILAEYLGLERDQPTADEYAARIDSLFDRFVSARGIRSGGDVLVWDKPDVETVDRLVTRLGVTKVEHLGGDIGQPHPELRQELGAPGPKARTVFLGRKRIIQLFAKADLSSVLHEMFHVWRDDMTPDESARLLKTLGETDWERTETINNKEVKVVEEKAARLFERWVREGKAEGPMADVMQKLGSYMARVYSDARDIPGAEAGINPETKAFFEEFLSLRLVPTELKPFHGVAHRIANRPGPFYFAGKGSDAALRKQLDTEKTLYVEDPSRGLRVGEPELKDWAWPMAGFAIQRSATAREFYHKTGTWTSAYLDAIGMLEAKKSGAEVIVFTSRGEPVEIVDLRGLTEESLQQELSRQARTEGLVAPSSKGPPVSSPRILEQADETLKGLLKSPPVIAKLERLQSEFTGFAAASIKDSLGLQRQMTEAGLEEKGELLSDIREGYLHDFCDNLIYREFSTFPFEWQDRLKEKFYEWAEILWRSMGGTIRPDISPGQGPRVLEQASSSPKSKQTFQHVGLLGRIWDELATLVNIAFPLGHHPAGRKLRALGMLVAGDLNSWAGPWRARIQALESGPNKLWPEDVKRLREPIPGNERWTRAHLLIEGKLKPWNPRVAAWRDLHLDIMAFCAQLAMDLKIYSRGPGGESQLFMPAADPRLVRAMTPDGLMALVQANSPSHAALMESLASEPGNKNVRGNLRRILKGAEMHEAIMQKELGAIEYKRKIPVFPPNFILNGKPIAALHSDPFTMLHTSLEDQLTRFAVIKHFDQRNIHTPTHRRLTSLVSALKDRAGPILWKGKGRLRALLFKAGVFEGWSDETIKAQTYDQLKWFAEELGIKKAPTRAELIASIDAITSLAEIPHKQINKLEEVLHKLGGINLPLRERGVTTITMADGKTRLIKGQYLHPVELLARVKERVHEVHVDVMEKLREQYIAEGGEPGHVNRYLALLQRLPYYGRINQHPIMKVWKVISSIIGSAQLSQAVIPNLPQTLLATSYFGPERFARAGAMLASDPRAAYRHVVEVGAFHPRSNRLAHESGLTSEWLSRGIQSIASHATGLAWISDYNNVFAALMAEELAKDWKSRGITPFEMWVAEDFGLSLADISDIQRLKMSDVVFKRIIQRGVARTQYVTEASYEQGLLTVHPIFRELFPYQSYSAGTLRSMLSMFQQLRKGLDILRRGGPPQVFMAGVERLMLMTGVYVGVGLLIDLLRRSLTGAPPPDDDKKLVDKAIQAFVETQVLGPGTRMLLHSNPYATGVEKATVAMMGKMRAVFDIVTVGYNLMASRGQEWGREGALPTTVQLKSLARKHFGLYRTAMRRIESHAWPEEETWREARRASSRFERAQGIPPKPYVDAAVNPEYYNVRMAMRRGDWAAAMLEAGKYYAAHKADRLDARTRLRASLVQDRPIHVADKFMVQFLSSLSPNERAKVFTRHRIYMAQVNVLAPLRRR